MELLERKIDDIARLCRLYKVSKLFVFGSVLRETFNDESDIDLIVNFEQVPLEEYADNYFNLKFELESIFNRSVDLLEEEAIKNPYFKKEVDREKQLIYG
jgi:predicted nucleotidyltransferase